MRSIIKRCQEKATQLKNERRQKELANTASLPSTNEVLYTPTAADQNMISGNGVSFQSQITDEPRLNHLPASNLENANYLTSNYSQMNNNSIVHQSHAMHNNSQMQPQHHSNHQQQQHQHPQQHQQHTPHQQFSQQHSQQMVHHQPQANYASNVMQTPVMAMGSHGSNKQMHSQAQKSSNAMLMTMLSDVPAANSQQFSTYAYQAQNAAFQQQQQQQPNAGQMNAMQIGQVKAKKPRKRKGTNGSTGMSPAGTDMPIKGVGGNILCLPSPKRKVSEDDFGRDMAATPSNSDLMDSAVGYDAFAGSGGQLPRPPSTASSSNYFLIT